MADHNEPCGCEETQLLREAINQYIEKHDDTGIRNMYEGPAGTFKLSPVGKLMCVDAVLSIDDRRQLYADIIRRQKEVVQLRAENEVLRQARRPVVASNEIHRIAQARSRMQYIIDVGMRRGELFAFTMDDARSVLDAADNAG